MVELKPVDLDMDKPFNYSEILNKTDEFIDMIVKLDIAYPVFSHTIRRLRELKYRIDLVRQRHPNLFSY